MKITSKNEKRLKRHRRVRAKVKGTLEMPRLSVFKSNMVIYAQLINDDKGMTISAASSLGIKGKSMLEKAKMVGTMIAEAAKSKKVSKVVFDRGGYVYTGKLKALADAAREGGLKF